MKFKFYNTDGSEGQEKEFPIHEFEGDKGVQALKDLLLAYQANVRQGNACTKTRGEVSGTGKKPWRQKGTGMARHGSRRSPIWRTGGVAHGPKPRDYTQKLNRKVKALGLTRALYESAKDGALEVIEKIEVSEAKTKIFDVFLKKVIPQGNVLIIDEAFEDNAMLSARNIQRVFMIDADSVNAWDLVRYKKILVTEKGLNRLLGRINA